MRTWLGPDVGPGSVVVGPVRVDRWQRQPLRTLLFGTSSNGKGEEKKEVRPGLFASVAVSKGHPSSHSDGQSLCAGLRLVDQVGQSAGPWFCPCDVRITLLGDRVEDFSRTVRWVLTPRNNEIFFDILPLAEVDKHFLFSGVLKLRGEILFHLSASKEPCPAPLSSSAQSSLLTAMMYSWCLAGPSAIKAALAVSSRVGPWDVSRDVVQQSLGMSATGCGDSHLALLAPGLLQPCSDPPRHFAQEVVPGLMIASEAVLSRLVELHDVGVGHLIEVAQQSAPDDSVDAPIFSVRLLQLRGTGDTVELVEEEKGSEVEDVIHFRSAKEIVLIIEESLKRVMVEPTLSWHVLVFPRGVRDAEACAVLVATVVARNFQLSFMEARRYLASRWDVAIDLAWGQRLSGDPELFAEDHLAPRAGDADGLLLEAVEAFGRGDADGAVGSKLAAWLASSAGLRR
ncbi:unnamed protein product, partial [Polarella glacialis]